MTTTLYAQPYDISATGFYFRSAEEYARKVSALRNSTGSPVREFESQSIDGDIIAVSECWQRFEADMIIPMSTAC